MKAINKRILLFCIIISVIVNGIFFTTQLSNHRLFEKDGIIKVLYVKSLNKDEATPLQKAKYTRVAKTLFITSNGDSIYDIRKNTWAMRADILEELNFYIPWDSVIYNRNNPKEYQLIAEYRNYSKTYSVLSYFVFGPILFTIWLYFLTIIISKVFERL